MRPQGGSRGGNPGIYSGGSSILAMSPAGPQGSQLLRVDPLGRVHYDGASDDSDGGDDSDDDPYFDDDGIGSGSSPPMGAMGRRLSGGSNSSGQGGGLPGLSGAGANGGDDPLPYDTVKHAVFQPATHLRPRSVPEGNKLRFSPNSLSHSACQAFFEEKLIIVFGGNKADLSGSGGAGGVSAASDETWVYDTEQKKWECFNQIGEHEVTDTMKHLRHTRGISGEQFPPPRCGHTVCGVKSVKIAEPISFSTADGQVIAPPVHHSSTGNQQQQLSPVKRHHHHHHHGHNNHAVEDDPEANDPTAYRPGMLMFGGADLQTGTYYNDLWLFDVQARGWTQVQAGGTKPTPRWQCISGALESRMFIFGGEGMNFEVLNDLHMFDNNTKMWAPLRIIEPIPAPRMMHAGCTVGDKLIVIGGIGTSSSVAGNQAKELSDVWILEMRTLLWRRLQTPTTTGGITKSPFYPLEPGAPLAFMKPHTIEGHVLIGFDDSVVLHGGKIGKNYNRHVWSLDLTSGEWTVVGEVSTQENRDGPQGRWQHCACSFREVNTTHTMNLAMTIDQYKDQRIHFTEEAETKVLINALAKRVARQINFEGVMMTHGNKPVMCRTLCGYIFGGSGYPRQFSDLWKIEMVDPTSNQMYDLLTHGKVRQPTDASVNASALSGSTSPGFGGDASATGRSRANSAFNLAGVPQAAVLADTDQLAYNFFFKEEGGGGDGELAGQSLLGEDMSSMINQSPSAGPAGKSSQNLPKRKSSQLRGSASTLAPGSMRK